MRATQGSKRRAPRASVSLLGDENRNTVKIPRITSISTTEGVQREADVTAQNCQIERRRRDSTDAELRLCGLKAVCWRLRFLAFFHILRNTEHIMPVELRSAAASHAATTAHDEKPQTRRRRSDSGNDSDGSSGSSTSDLITYAPHDLDVNGETRQRTTRQKVDRRPPSTFVSCDWPFDRYGDLVFELTMTCVRSTRSLFRR